MAKQTITVTKVTKTVSIKPPVIKMVINNKAKPTHTSGQKRCHECGRYL